jgi:hypothetical protein
MKIKKKILLYFCFACILYSRWKLLLECIEVVLVYVSNKLPCIFTEATWFFPSNIHLRGPMKRDISYTWWWGGYGWRPFVHILFCHYAALCDFFFPFHSLPVIRRSLSVNGFTKRNAMTFWPQYFLLFLIIWLARTFAYTLDDISLPSPLRLEIWTSFSESFRNCSENGWHNAMMNKEEKVEDGIFVS